VDLGIFRNLKFKERITLQIRGELTNAFNLVNLSNPNATESVSGGAFSSSFGTIRSAAAMRQTQLGLRLTF
jgi:hypothetical protein